MEAGAEDESTISRACARAMRALRATRLVPALATLAAAFSVANAGERELVDLSIEELSQVIVSSVSRREEPLHLAASAVQVIASDDIERSGATRLPEALRLASNLQVAQISGNSWAISARGFNSALANKLLVMIDGRTIYSPLFAGTFWDAHEVPLFDVDRIEVVSGPGGALWGANAVNGVINVITRPATETQGLLLRAGGGDELRAAGALRYGGSVGERIHYRIYGMHWDRDGVQRANGADAGDDSRLGQVGFRVDWTLSDADALTVQGDANESRIESLVLDDSVARSRNVLARWTRTLSDSSYLQLQAYFDRAHRLSPGAYRDELDTFDVELLHSFRPWSAHEFVWGLTWREMNDDFGVAAFRLDPAATSLERMGAFAQDQIELATDRLFLTIGAKVEDNEYTGEEWQPSIALSWRYRREQSLWARISRAVRTPSRFDRDLANPTSPPFTVGSDLFESEELMAYEAGVRIRAFETVAASAAAYYNEYDELRSFERLNPSLPIPTVIGNGLEGDSHGLELTAEYRPNARWSVWAGYSYRDLDFDVKPGSLDASGGVVEARDWRHQALLRGSFDWRDEWRFSAELRRNGRVDSHRLPAYTELDMRAAWRIAPTIELELVGRNLLDSAHAEFGPPGRLLIERAAYALFTWTPR